MSKKYNLKKKGKTLYVHSTWVGFKLFMEKFISIPKVAK